MLFSDCASSFQCCHRLAHAAKFIFFKEKKKKSFLCFLGSLFHIELHLLKTRNNISMREKAKNMTLMTIQQNISFSFILLVCGSSAHFYYVRCHGLQWDQSRLLHVDLLFISNYPWEILKKQIYKCNTKDTTAVIMCGKGALWWIVLFISLIFNNLHSQSKRRVRTV